MTIADRPRTPHALHAWIGSTLGVRLCRHPLIHGHNAPFDYILHTYFEGVIPADTHDDSPGPRPEPRNNGLATRDPSVRLPASPAYPPDLVLWANRGGGKTFLGAIATVLDLLFKPAIQVRILAGSLEQASRMLDHLRAFFSLPDLAHHVAGRITQRRIALTNDSAVEILAASESSVRGTRVQKLRCDEVDLFDPDLWDAAQLTTRSAMCGDVHVRGAVECLSTMHRPHGLMFRLVKQSTEGARRLLKWGVVDALENCPPSRPCRSPDADCPLLPECAGRAKRESGTAPRPTAPLDASMTSALMPSLASLPPDPSPGHITIDDAITMKSRVSQAVWESEMLCLRPSRAATVFPEFDPDVHVVRDAPHQAGRCVAGMDFGFRAPTVILWGMLDPEGTLWITHERVQAETHLEEHIGAITDAPGRLGVPLPTLLGVDPAGQQRHEQTGISNIDVLRRAGLPVSFRALSLGEGLELLRRRLRPASGPPRLLIHRRCARLIESLTCYSYPDNPESMTPLKDGHDHAVDALRYLVVCLDRPHRCATGRYVNGA